MIRLIRGCGHVSRRSFFLLDYYYYCYKMISLCSTFLVFRNVKEVGDTEHVACISIINGTFVCFCWSRPYRKPVLPNSLTNTKRWRTARKNSLADINRWRSIKRVPFFPLDCCWRAHLGYFAKTTNDEYSINWKSSYRDTLRRFHCPFYSQRSFLST